MPLQVGHLIMEASAKSNLKRVTLELGTLYYKVLFIVGVLEAFRTVFINDY